MEPGSGDPTTDPPGPPSPGDDATLVPPSDRAATGTSWSMRRASLTAGAGLLLMGVLGGFGYLVAVEGLVTPGNPTRTVTDIRASETLFRFGIVALFAVVALDVLVAWALYRVFRPVSDGLSLLAAGFRLVYAGVYLAALGQLVGVLDLLGSDGQRAAFSTEQVHAQALLRIETFDDVYSAGLVLFGLHLLVLGYLAYRSGFVPRFLGVLLAIAGLGYAFDSVAAVLSGGSAPEMSMFTFFGEVLLAFWLLIWGRRLGPNGQRHAGRVRTYDSSPQPTTTGGHR